MLSVSHRRRSGHRFAIVAGNRAAVQYLLQGEYKGLYGDMSATRNKIETMSGEVFELNEPCMDILPRLLPSPSIRDAFWLDLKRKQAWYAETPWCALFCERCMP